MPKASTALGAALLGGETAGFHLELLERIREGQRHGNAVVGIDVTDSVQFIMGAESQ